MYLSWIKIFVFHLATVFIPNWHVLASVPPKMLDRALKRLFWSFPWLFLSKWVVESVYKSVRTALCRYGSIKFYPQYWALNMSVLSLYVAIVYAICGFVKFYPNEWYIYNWEFYMRKVRFTRAKSARTKSELIRIFIWGAVSYPNEW